MADDPKWKNGLLGSGLPLQSEAAGVLVSKGFRVDADFKYSRPDRGGPDRFAVDLHARATTPFSDQKQVTGTLDLVVECRQVTPQSGWVFLPDPNSTSVSMVASGNAVRVIDEFSLCRVDAGAAKGFDAGMPICCKGLQIDLATGEVDSGEPYGGLEQLQHALPRLMVESVLLSFREHSAENVPLLFCPVLVTTAPLLVAGGGLGVEQVQRCSQLRELAAEVPCLVMVSDYAPEFESHCRREFSALEGLQRNDDLLKIEMHRAGLPESRRKLPVATIEALITADRPRLQNLFTRFIVCTKSELPSLVEKIRRTAESAIQSRKELQ